MHTEDVLIFAAILSCALAPPADPPCTLYTESFNGFAGPAVFENEFLHVEWCLGTASVATGGFCNTGNAIRLDSSNDDPIIWVKVLKPTCSSISLSFSYSQFAATGTVLKRAVATDSTLNCSKSISTSAIALNGTGACISVTDIVALAPGQSVYWKVDHGTPSSNAIFIDSITVALTGCCSQHDCCSEGPAGCEDRAVSACVCAADPYCCETEWDAICVNEVESLGCASCQPPPPPCATTWSEGFGNFYTPGSVCAIFPDEFESCEGIPPYISSTTACGGLTDMSLRFSTGYPWSSATTTCVDLNGFTNPQLEFSYAKDLGTLGPRIDISVDNGPFSTIWSGPVNVSPGCHDVVLDLAEFADASVRFKLSSGSSVSNGAAIDDMIVSEASLHECCEPGGPGCADPEISACVCAGDAFCCEQEWDAICVVEAKRCGAMCSTPMCGAADAGDCLVSHPTPFCGDESCCVAICAVDPFCCTQSWDEVCAAEADSVCNGAACGRGSCNGAHDSPGCADASCCEAVCLVDAVCCLLAWDEICVAEAASICSDSQIGDVNQDGSVNGADLGLVLASWGVCGQCPADFDANGAVDGADLGILLSNWTP